MRPTVLLFFLLSLLPSLSWGTCTDEDLRLLQQRVSCEHSNTPANCASLASMGAGGAAMLTAKLARLNPKAKAYSDFFKEIHSVNADLQSSYRTALEVYYELKKKAGDTKGPPTKEMIWEDYKKYKALMDADPRLKNNYFLEKFNAYGKGQGHDVFQRAYTYAVERSAPNFKSKGIQFDNGVVYQSAESTLFYSMDSAKKIFREVSVEAGFPENGAVDMDKVDASIARSSQELNAERDSVVRSTNRRASGTKLGAFDALGAAMMATSAVDIATRNWAVTQCAKQWNIPLSITEVSSLAAVSDINGGMSHANQCDHLQLLPEMDGLLQKGISPGVRNYLCAMADRIGPAQDANLSDKVIDQIQNNPTCENKWTVSTSKGDVTVYLNSVNEWDYSRFKATDPDFEQYLQEKLKSPMNSLATRSQRLSPDQACTPDRSGRLDKAYCDLSRELFSYGQMSDLHHGMCAMKILTPSFQQNSQTGHQ